MDKTIIIASNNKHKVREIRNCLRTTFSKIMTLRDKPTFTEAEETGETFEENSYIKAKYVYQHTKVMSLSDDSGLVVPALGNAPGVFSSRYAGFNVSDQDNVQLLLTNMATLKGDERKAYFQCVITLYYEKDTMEQILCAEGKVYGRILEEPRGENGFGYDPIFCPEGYDESFAELGEKIKNSISHRGNALVNLGEKLKLFKIE